MIKPNELRIGNLVYRDNDDGICKVTGIVNDGFIQYQINDENTYGEPFESFEGIPITEEWILKFGFKNQKVNSGLLYSKHINNKGYISIYAVFTEPSYDSLIERKLKYWTLDLAKWYKPKLKYIHQLQNLYFALTGEELTIKE